MRLGIAAKIIIAVAIPALGFIGMSAISVYERWQVLREVEATEQAFAYAVASSGLVHELQKERGASALFIGARGAQFGTELKTQRADTDKAAAGFATALQRLKQTASLQALGSLGDKTVQALEALPARRSQVDALTLSGPQSFAGYTQTIRVALVGIHGLSDVTRHPDLTAALGAYLAVLEGKEKAGQERATGAGAFAAKKFEPDVYQRFVGLGLTQEADFADFSERAKPEQVAYYKQIQAHASFAEVQRLRKIGYDFIATASTGDIAGPYWFQTTTQRIDQLKLLEDRLGSDLLALCAQIRSAERGTLGTEAIIVLALLLAAALLSGLIIRGITVPLAAVVGAMSRLAGGDTGVTIAAQARKDQIGDLVEAYETFRTNAQEKQALEAGAAAQRSEAERVRGVRDVREQAAAAEIGALVNGILSGNLSSRLDEQGKEGFFLDVTQRLNRLAEMLQDIVGNMAGVMAALADGDLRKSVQGDYAGVFGELKDNTNRMGERLQDFAGRLAISADAVHAAASEISTGSQDLAGRTESQAASIEETAASMHEITTTVRQNADNAQAANQLATAARDTAEKGGSVVAEAVKAVSQIEGSARKIADIVGLIDEIAFQTNLLALNASVEAARAGEAGKGFAVVAQEVRALAQRSANASKDIKALIAESNAQVKTGADLVNQTGVSLVDIVAAVKKVTDIVAEIAAASKEQATGLDQVNTAVGNMDEMTQRNGALVEETSASAQALAGQAQELARLVGFFKRA